MSLTPLERDQLKADLRAEILAELRPLLVEPKERKMNQPLTTREAMKRLGYKSGKRFWEAVRRLRVPYERLSKRHAVFNSSAIDAALAKRRVGKASAA